MNSIGWILCWCALLSTVSAAYDPKLTVANIDTGCPIPNVPFPPEQFSVDSLITTFAPLAQKIPRQDCVQQAVSLASCALDGSLGIKTGCCSTECSGAMAKVNSANCFPDILQTLCLANAEQQAQIQRLIPVLTTVAERCANYRAPPSVTCSDGRILSTAGAASGR